MVSLGGRILYQRPQWDNEQTDQHAVQHTPKASETCM